MDEATPPPTRTGFNPTPRSLSFLPRRLLRRLSSETQSGLLDFHRAVGRFCSTQPRSALQRRAGTQRLVRHLCPGEGGPAAGGESSGRPNTALGRALSFPRDVPLRSHTQRWAALLYGEIKRLRAAGCDTATCLRTLIDRIPCAPVPELQPKRPRLWDAVAADAADVDGIADAADVDGIADAVDAVDVDAEAEAEALLRGDFLPPRAHVRMRRMRSPRDCVARLDPHRPEDPPCDAGLPPPKVARRVEMSCFPASLWPLQMASLDGATQRFGMEHVSLNELLGFSELDDEQNESHGGEDDQQRDG